MIAAWMIYCALCALGLFVAAAAAEHALLAGRRAVRPVWLAAVAMSLVVPMIALRYGAHPQPASVAASAREGVALDSSAVLAASSAPPVVGSVAPLVPTHVFAWRSVVERNDRSLLIAWLVSSAALALYFLGGMIALALMRRGWRRDVVLDVPVLVSESVGPALVGAMSPAIVLPEWALAMEPHQLALMLLHEQEHRRARDGQLLTVAQIALIAMPWNVALWWQVLRLRMAVELDCDARVLRAADARSYGHLLLEVVRPGRRLQPMGATAFAERAGQLERRIRVLAKPRGRVVRGSRVAAALIGLVAIAAAWSAPRPAAPLLTLFASSATPGTAKDSTHALENLNVSRPASDSLPRPAESSTPSTTPRVDAASTAAPANQHDASPTFAGDTLVTVVRHAGDSLAVVQRTQTTVPGNDSALFHQLFDGISLTPSQQAAAHELLAHLMLQQLVANVSSITSSEQARSQQQAVLAARDSALRALAPTDDDRALLASRMAGGARGRVPMPPDGLGGGRGGRSGGSGVGNGAPVVTGGARGRSGGAAPPSSVTIEMQFNRLFDGITLTPEQAARARMTIGIALQAMQRLAPRPATYIEPQASGLIAVQPDGATALLSILPNEADRQVLQTRIVVAVPTPSTPPKQ
ncbi:MAG TPA: M56 family metallopeptidase [Gemmatimonadaceae bacterium]|jgi:beta-lactamase regulating signal transducer with metallopeptidase domain